MGWIADWLVLGREAGKAAFHVFCVADVQKNFTGACELTLQLKIWDGANAAMNTVSLPAVDPRSKWFAIKA